ncbi:MAG TPA: response regulator [Gemmataceae bacterium]|nr:response regulator [Gemmataceae bacterium]
MSASPRIALIDDDRIWLETLAEYLRDRGYGVETALGGRRGLGLLERGGIRLAVVDFHMPDLDGVELLRHLRRRRLDVDVLLMSSDDDPALPVRVLREGAAAFLSKNAAPGLLLRSLTQTLSAVFAEMALRPPARSRWDRFLPVPRRAEPWLPMPLRPGESERN